MLKCKVINQILKTKQIIIHSDGTLISNTSFCTNVAHFYSVDMTDFNGTLKKGFFVYFTLKSPMFVHQI